jgi:hypothetical protein
MANTSLVSDLPRTGLAGLAQNRTDLLVGVAIGMVAEFIVHLLRSVNWGDLLRLYFKIEERKPDPLFFKM